MRSTLLQYDACHLVSGIFIQPINFLSREVLSLPFVVLSFMHFYLHSGKGTDCRTYFPSSAGRRVPDGADAAPTQYLCFFLVLFWFYLFFCFFFLFSWKDDISSGPSPLDQCGLVAALRGSRRRAVIVYQSVGTFHTASVEPGHIFQLCVYYITAIA
ncbi:hypothetical protein ASPZODRAFT_1639411 [Penicilliopsis zonata CBS 506.65]|uniref:Uncharacterized protein n=1 Tax=Penicilliopsis zonata CBS 506.65 TaxID=1073090 RepID=A0A1L9SNJ8_9EURO|nr:hypothetical protein ASPZODRAFT_1639411 [Penicilliopsis zonata CBS 506.65]OJJ48617.1 hypothetical protein ASPZODRAFT_1639411 [Penicilliopsis zonata CBS 506.65]